MTTLAHRSGVRGATNGGVAARRAVVRWAWRMFRREWRQQILVVALLTVAVAAAIGSIALVYNTSPAFNGEFGSASGLLVFDGSDPRGARGSPGIGRGVIRDDGRHRPPQGARARRRRDGGLPLAGPGWALRRRSPRAPEWQLPGRARPGRPHRGCGRAPKRGAGGDARSRRAAADRRRPRREPTRSQ